MKDCSTYGEPVACIPPSQPLKHIKPLLTVAGMVSEVEERGTEAFCQRNTMRWSARPGHRQKSNTKPPEKVKDFVHLLHSIPCKQPVISLVWLHTADSKKQNETSAIPLQINMWCRAIWSTTSTVMPSGWSPFCVYAGLSSAQSTSLIWKSKICERQVCDHTRICVQLPMRDEGPTFNSRWQRKSKIQAAKYGWRLGQFVSIAHYCRVKGSTTWPKCPIAAHREKQLHSCCFTALSTNTQHKS